MTFRDGYCALAILGCAVVSSAAAQNAPMSFPRIPASLGPEAEKHPTPPRDLDKDAARGTNGYLAACLSALANGVLAKAEQACSQAIASNPRLATEYKLRGYVYLIEHRFERAAEDFRIALEIQPNDSENRAGYGQSLSGMGQFSAAVSEFSKAVSLSPATAAYHNGLCWARAGTGRNLQTALADCNRALALAPGSAGSFNSRGLVQLRLGRLQAAVADYDTSLASKPSQPSARFGRGLARLGLRQTAKGVSDVSEARRADPEIDDLFITLGVLRRNCGRGPVGVHCPPGFPRRPVEKASPRPWLVVKNSPQAEDQRWTSWPITLCCAQVAKVEMKSR
ncbi:MAG: tetratricopeptide repeat protein [Rhizomicrobium sp.]